MPMMKRIKTGDNLISERSFIGRRPDWDLGSNRPRLKALALTRRAKRGAGLLQPRSGDRIGSVFEPRSGDKKIAGVRAERAPGQQTKYKTPWKGARHAFRRFAAPYYLHCHRGLAKNARPRLLSIAAPRRKFPVRPAGKTPAF